MMESTVLNTGTIIIIRLLVTVITDKGLTVTLILGGMTIITDGIIHMTDQLIIITITTMKATTMIRIIMRNTMIGTTDSIDTGTMGGSITNKTTGWAIKVDTRTRDGLVMKPMIIAGIHTHSVNITRGVTGAIRKGDTLETTQRKLIMIDTILTRQVEMIVPVDTHRVVVTQKLVVLPAIGTSLLLDEILIHIHSSSVYCIFQRDTAFILRKIFAVTLTLLD